MYSPAVVADRQAALEARFSLPIRRTPVPQAIAMAEHLTALWDPELKSLKRPLDEAEQQFVVHEQILSQIDFRYWAERYAMVNKGAKRLEPLYPLWASQELVIQRFAEREAKQFTEGYQDGLFFIVLKARQLGVSTLSQAIIVHRLTTQPYGKFLIASDVSTSSGNLFGMSELLYRHLPWYLKPAATKYVLSGEQRTIALDNESFVLMQSGKAMRGQKVEESGEGKGEMGRSFTFTGVHLSELASWENPEQIDGSLLPAIPVAPYTFGLFESTAKGRYNWWHQLWMGAEKGATPVHDIGPIFIPWYAEPEKWRLRPPAEWMPNAATISHARKCEEDAPRWLGKSVTLTRDQLYWYERSRVAAEDKDAREPGALATFLSEYPATPEECFQYSGRSIFSLAVRERIKSQARPILAVCLVEPHALAQERAQLVREGGIPG